MDEASGRPPPVHLHVGAASLPVGTADFDLLTRHVRLGDEDQGPDVPADVDDDGALSRCGVLVGHGDGVLNPSYGWPRYGTG